MLPFERLVAWLTILQHLLDFVQGPERCSFAKHLLHSLAETWSESSPLSPRLTEAFQHAILKKNVLAAQPQEAVAENPGLKRYGRYDCSRYMSQRGVETGDFHNLETCSARSW